MLKDNELELKLRTSPAERVTKEYMESRIARVMFTAMRTVEGANENDCATICTIYLDNGYTVRGESACVNPANYNPEIGERIAYDNAVNALWPLFGFLLAESNLQNSKEELEFSLPYKAMDNLWHVEAYNKQGSTMFEFNTLDEAITFINKETV